LIREEHPVEVSDLRAEFRFRVLHLRMLLKQSAQGSLREPKAVPGLDQLMADCASGPIADAFSRNASGDIGDEALRWISKYDAWL
jgi:hypothetical protein